MAKTIDAAKPKAGKKNGAKKNNVNSRITAEIGKMWLTLKKLNGKCLIEFSTDCVDPDLNALCDFAADEHGVALEPEQMFDNSGWITTEIAPKVFDAIRRWVVKNTDWKLMREVKG